MRHAATALAIAGLGSLILGHTGRAQAAPAATLNDATIVAIFDAANTWDIESSGLAATKSHNPDVIALANQFVRDHTTVRQQGRDLAKKLGVTPTPPKNPPLYQDHVAAMAKLRAASPADFDRAYLQNEVAYHKAVIDAINTVLLPAIQNAELKAFVIKVGPAFQGHMVAAQYQLDKLPKS
jgi:putative membrane protein